MGSEEEKTDQTQHKHSRLVTEDKSKYKSVNLNYLKTSGVPNHSGSSRSGNVLRCALLVN